MYFPGVAVFGSGDIVNFLVPVLRHFGFSVEAIWCRTLDEAEKYSRSLNIPCKTAKEDEVLLLKKVELIFIVCPPHQQSEIAVKALNIGKHVICGLPVAHNSAEAEKMVKAARYYPSLMCVLSNGLRFLPCFIKMKQLIVDNFIGSIVTCEARIYCLNAVVNHYDWTCEEKMGGGILHMQGSFVIDLLTYLINQKAHRVHGILRTYNRQSENVNGIRQITSDDFCSFQMDMNGGACAVITLSHHVPKPYFQEICISGTKGSLIVRDCNLFGLKLGQAEELLYNDSNDIYNEKLTLPENINENYSDCSPHLKGLWKMIESMKDAFDLIEDRCGWVTQPINTAATFYDGEYIEAVIDAVKRSNSTHEWVTLPKSKLMKQ